MTPVVFRLIHGVAVLLNTFEKVDAHSAAQYIHSNSPTTKFMLVPVEGLTRPYWIKYHIHDWGAEFLGDIEAPSEVLAAEKVRETA